MRGHPEYDRDGLLARVYGVTFDISQHRQHEERLSLSERRYRALVESTGAMVWSAGPDGRILPAGGSWSEFATDSSRMAGWGWLELVHPEDREITRRAWHDAHSPKDGAVAHVSHAQKRRRLSRDAGACGAAVG